MGRISFWSVPKRKARFRISIKDNRTGETLKVELLEQLWPGRYWIRQDGKVPDRYSEASLSMVFTRSRRWMVARVRRE